MNTNFTVIDAIFKSRMTLLELLEARGYDVEKFRTFTPADALKSVADYPSLSFTVQKKDDPTHKCEVQYKNITRQMLDKLFASTTPEEAATTEYVIMLQDSLTDAHHATAIKKYMSLQENAEGERVRRKIHVSFFSIYTIVINPLKHVLVPKHEIVPESEHPQLMESLFIVSKSKLPEIKYHIDPITRCIGAVPGDIIKITRPSQSAGNAIIYRVCV